MAETGLLFAIPGGFIAAIKAGFAEGWLTVTQAGVLGFGVSVPIFARKRLPLAFKLAGKVACETRKEIRNSFMLYYFRETARENVANLRRVYNDPGKLIETQLRPVADRTHKITKRVKELVRFRR